MAFWEFLLQKEGDRSWLPLESPQVEILEGKYRVVARSSQANTPVEIRIIHDATAEIPPVRRTQKRHGKTNREGLIVIMPFTRLLPGVWQLRCMSDLMSDMLGSGWEYALNLNVLPIEPDLSDEWDSDWDSGITATEGITAAEGIGLEQAPSATQPASEPQPLPVANVAADAEGEAAEPAESTLAVDPLSTERIASDSVAPDSVAPDSAASSTLPDPEADQASQITEAGEASRLLPLAPRSTDNSADDLDNLANDHPLTPTAPPSADRPSRVSPLQMAAQQSQEVVDSVFQEFESSTELDTAAHSSAAEANLEASVVSQLLPYAPTLRLNLGQETYVIQRGQAVTLMGQVESIDDLLTYELLPVEALEVRLYDPRTSRILVEKRQPLTARRLPFPFTCRITLPEHYQTYLVLGELILYGAADGDVPPPVLASQSFNVTTDLHELIEAIANDYAEADLPAPPEATPAQAEIDRHSEVSFPTASNAATTEISFKTSIQQPLPPQLHPPEPERSNKPLELPNFSNQTAIDDDSDVGIFGSNSSGSDRSDSDCSDSDRSDQNLPDLTASEQDALDPSLSAFDESIAASLEASSEASSDEEESVWGEIVDNPNEATDSAATVAASLTPQSFDDAPLSNWTQADRLWEPESKITQEDQATSEVDDSEPESPETAAFRALNLQERFWGRLQALIADTELSGWLSEIQAEESGGAEPSEADEVDAVPLGRLKRRSIGQDAKLAAQEVVAEDELVSVSSSNTGTPGSLEAGQPTMTLVLPIDEPVPAPQIEVQAGELTAGQSLTITVKIPYLRPRIFVKLWLSERQSRSILDGPHWLTDFLPDGFGNLLTRTEVTVPHGCIEIQVEAIAVEMSTQRESDKAAIVRDVVPADLSPFSLDELDT
jgi:hypothetical protein